MGDRTTGVLRWEGSVRSARVREGRREMKG